MEQTPQTPITKIPIPPNGEYIRREHITLEEISQEAGLNLGTIDAETRGRLRLLHEKTATLKDERHAILLVKQFIENYEKNAEKKSFTIEEQRTVFLGTLLSDIGKTGPHGAPLPVQKCIAEMYGIDIDLEPPAEIMTVQEFLGKFFLDDAKRRLGLLSLVKVTPEMTMREFFKLHAKWTWSILKHAIGIPRDALVAAATHHVLEGVDPVGILEVENTENHKKPRLKLSRAAKLVILLDKYDAARSRGKLNHKDAIARLRSTISRNLRSAPDGEFAQLITDMEIVFTDNTLYDKAALE